MTHHLLNTTILLLAVTVAIVALCGRLRMPPILGYLFVGMLLGPYALGWFDDSEGFSLLGEIGIAFLLFAIGLEFSLTQFWAMRRTLLGLGGLQVIVGTISGGMIAWLIGIPWQIALIVGGALAMSSTAMVVKQLTDQFELQQLHGRLALGVLLFQDLAAVPFLVIIPILAQGNTGLAWPLLLALCKAVIAVVVMLGAGRLLLRPVFHEIAARQAPELFTLTVLLVSLLAAWLTSLLGLSLALGAFLAGMMLSETEYRHQIDTDIRPFKDVLLGLFFIAVGAQLNFAALPALWFWIVLLVTGLIIGKGLLIAALAWTVEREPKVALRTGLILGHGGEFGLALLALALGTGLLDVADSQPILAAIIISMLAAPVLISKGEELVLTLFPPPTPDADYAQGIAQALQDKRGQVIVCGYGRVGKQLCGFLRDESIEFVALDLDPKQLSADWEEGASVFFGDASHRNILLAAGLEHARALVVSFDHPHATLKILNAARQLREDVPILVRARDDANLQRFLAAGATEVVPETLEATLMLTTQLLLLLDVPTQKITDVVSAVRDGRYRLLREFNE